MTYDHTHYSFVGTCTYVATRALDGSFSVAIQSVACGSTGVTCTKAVAVVHDNVTVHMTRGADIKVPELDLNISEQFY